MERKTTQKKLVTDVMHRLANHPSAEAVYLEVHKTHPRVSKATVYRILKEEAARGNLRSVDIPRDVNRYDHRTEEHWHIRCRVCGRIGDVEGLHGTDGMYVRPEGWTVENVVMSFYGICADCAAKAKNDISGTEEDSK